MIEIATLKTYDAVNHRAGVQLAGSLTTYLDDIPVSVGIPPSAMVIGNRVVLAIPGGNPKDACVIATWPQGTPGGGMEVHGNEYHDPDFEQQGLAAALVEVHRTTAEHTQPQPSNFLKLSDTPDSYSGQANKVPVVNASENALIFAPRDWELIADQYFSSPATSWTLSGLNGDADIQYLVTLFLVWASATPGGLLLRPNNDSGNNYPRQYVTASGTSVTAASDTQNGFWLAWTDTQWDRFLCPLMTLHAVSGRNRVMFGFRHRIQRWFSFIAEWANTADNITSLAFVADQANAIGTGSRITVWRRARA